MTQPVIAIAGAGMAGASLAYALAATHTVMLFERESQPGYHSTGRSAAVLAKAYGNDTIRALTVLSEPFFLRPPNGFSDVPLLADLGELLIARADQHDLIEQEAERARRFVSTVEILDASAVLARVPQLRSDYVAGGVLETSSTAMDVDAIHQGYLRGAREFGAEILTDQEILSLSRTAGGWSIGTSEKTWHADIIVNAAGAWADDLATRAGVQAFGLVPHRRTAFTVDPPEGAQIDSWPLVADIEEQFYFKPDAGFLLCSPGDETPSPACDAQPEELDIAVAADRIQQALDIEISRIRSKWAGLRTFAADRTPVLGFDPQVEGFFWLAGQGGYGIQTAPAMADAAAALIRGQEPAVPIRAAVAAMSPDRLTSI